MPTFSPVYVNSVFPAIALGRGVSRREKAVLSSGNTLYLAASLRKSACIFFRVSGYLADKSLNCVKSSLRLYNSHLYPESTLGNLPVANSQGGAKGVVFAYHPS